MTTDSIDGYSHAEVMAHFGYTDADLDAIADEDAIFHDDMIYLQALADDVIDRAHLFTVAPRMLRSILAELIADMSITEFRVIFGDWSDVPAW